MQNKLRQSPSHASISQNEEHVLTLLNKQEKEIQQEIVKMAKKTWKLADPLNISVR